MTTFGDDGEDLRELSGRYGGTTRAEHLAWAKERALGYADAGDIPGAIALLTSDLGRHPGTAGHPAIDTMTILAEGSQFARPGELGRFIEGID